MVPRFGLALDFGVTGNSVAQRIDEYLPVIDAAEEAAAFSSIWLGESYPTSARDPGGFHLPAPLLVASALAGRTRLGLGTGVSLSPAWHPLRLAYDAAVADQVTGGRLRLGVGLGPPGLGERFGNRAGPRGAVVEDQISFMRAMWRGDQRYDGAYYTSTAGIWPLPLQPGGPPVLVGGGVEASARRAARYGDGYYASSGYRFEQVAQLATIYRQALGAESRAGAVLVNRITLVHTDGRLAESLVDRHVAPLLDAYTRLGTLRGGGTAAKADRSGGIALVGTPDEVVPQLLSYLDCGVTDVQFRVRPHGLPVGDAVRTVRLLATEVIPRALARLSA